MSYEVGQVHERWTPFIVEDKKLTYFDGENFTTSAIKHWRPGLKSEPIYPDDARPVWDGEGAEIRRIVSIASIEGGGKRILYRRTWRRPDGGEFGKARVRMTTPSAFTAWLRGSGYLKREIEEWRERDR